MDEDKNTEGNHTVVQVDVKEDVENIDNELNDRINRLYGVVEESSTPNPIEYDPKELQTTRKKLLLLLLIVLLALVIIIILLFSPLTSDDSKNNDDSPTEETNQDDDSIELGEMSLTDLDVILLNQKISFSFFNYQRLDFFSLYQKESLTSNEFENSIKMYFIKNSSHFEKLLEDKEIQLEDYATTCDSTDIVIDKSEFDQIVTKVLGPNVTVDYTPINFFYDNQTISFVYADDKYTATCTAYQTPSDVTQFTQHQLVKANRKEEGIELYQYVVFINQNGVYKDPNFQTLITNDTEATIDTYISQGATYKHTFIKDENDNYYLAKIEIVKEDNA